MASKPVGLISEKNPNVLDTHRHAASLLLFFINH
jgi:hypothetical protein